MRPVIADGYSRKMASLWYRRTQYDYRHYQDQYSAQQIKSFHDRGYLCHSAEKYQLLKNTECKYITDFDYLYLSPFNNSFSKWIGDMLTTGRVLKDFSEHFRNIYFSIVHRGKKTLVLKVDDENRAYTVEDILALACQKGIVELRPASWTSDYMRYTLKCVDGAVTVNDEPCDAAALQSLLDELAVSYVVADYVDLYHEFGNGVSGEYTVKLWVANDAGEEPQVLAAQASLFWDTVENMPEKPQTEADGEAVSYEQSSEESAECSSDDTIEQNADVYGERRRVKKLVCVQREHMPAMVDLKTGSFVMDGKEAVIDGWDDICRTICAVAKTMDQLSYFTTTIALGKDEPFRFLRFSASPYLPEVAYNDELNDYLKNKWAVKNANRNLTNGDRFAAAKNSLFHRYVKKHVRPGMRPYMYRLWLDAKKSDRKNTTGVSMAQKRWAWKRGFQSFRIYQYGLTEENYKEFLSDFDYYWLNRINNNYQIWVNDKTTFRYLMEPFKQYIPDYYLSLFKRDGKVCVSRMWDCPDGVEESIDGLCALLKEKGRLALKPSAGTHGDGFYCRAYEDGNMMANGEVLDRDGLEELIGQFHSYYVATEYIEMHDDIKKIYAKSVNSIRVMVINSDGYNPEIMQSYMRIGSSRTGYTDNVGYGGICVMVNKETGELYQPETITNHVFNPCPTHPDTGTPIAGVIPNWELICTKIKEICRYMSELEYLGFDIAVTNDGFRVIEINIHQDLHKVPTFSKEVKEFFQQKISDKMQQFD